MFRKKRKANRVAARVTDQAAARIVKAVGRLQNGFARFMNQQTNHYSAKTWAVLIIVLAVTWVGFSLYFISTALSKQPVVQKRDGQMFIIRPVHKDSLEWMEKVYQEKSKEQKNK